MRGSFHWRLRKLRRAARVFDGKSNLWFCGSDWGLDDESLVCFRIINMLMPVNWIVLHFCEAYWCSRTAICFRLRWPESATVWAKWWISWWLLQAIAVGLLGTAVTALSILAVIRFELENMPSIHSVSLEDDPRSTYVTTGQEKRLSELEWCRCFLAVFHRTIHIWFQKRSDEGRLPFH